MYDPTAIGVINPQYTRQTGNMTNLLANFGMYRGISLWEHFQGNRIKYQDFSIKLPIKYPVLQGTEQNQKNVS